MVLLLIGFEKYILYAEKILYIFALFHCTIDSVLDMLDRLYDYNYYLSNK
jgi:hypothetical protein